MSETAYDGWIIPPELGGAPAELPAPSEEPPRLRAKALRGKALDDARARAASRASAEAQMPKIAALTRDHRERLAERAEERAETARKLSKSVPVDELVERVRQGQKTMVNRRDAEALSENWWNARANGQRERFPNVENCGKGKIVASCGACGCVREVPAGCACPRLCVACRDRTAKRRRGRILRARPEVLSRAQKLGLNMKIRKGGRWSERMLTLTIPHIGSGPEGAAARVRGITEAWKDFVKDLHEWRRDRLVECAVVARRIERWKVVKRTAANADKPCALEWVEPYWTTHGEKRWRVMRHVERTYKNLSKEERKTFSAWCRESGIAVCLAWYRCFELTPGQADLFGNPHWHVWMHGPWIDRDAVAAWWTKALAAQGVARPDGEDVVIHVKNVSFQHAEFQLEAHKGEHAIKLISRDGGKDTIDYLESWSMAEIDPQGRRVSAEVRAAWYRELEGRRLVQTSRGLLKLGDRPVCCPDCSEEVKRKTEITGWRRLGAMVSPEKRPPTQEGPPP